MPGMGKLAGYSILDIGHSNVQCPISNIQLNSRSSQWLGIVSFGYDESKVGFNGTIVSVLLFQWCILEDKEDNEKNDEHQNTWYA